MEDQTKAVCKRRLMKTMMWMKRAASAAVVLLSLFSLGLSAPVNSCDGLVKPITVQHEDVSAHVLYD